MERRIATVEHGSERIVMRESPASSISNFRSVIDLRRGSSSRELQLSHAWQDAAGVIQVQHVRERKREHFRDTNTR